MLGFLTIIKAEVVRSYIIMRRYWFRTLVGLVVGYGMLVGTIFIFVTNRAAIDEAVAGRFEDATGAMNFLLGLIIGLFAFGIVGLFTQGLQGMARSGVLEQLCMSPHGLATNFLARATVSAWNSITSSAIMVFLVSQTFDQAIHWDTLPVLALLLLTFANLLGFGYLMGGLVLVFKQVGQVAVLLRLALFGLAIPIDRQFLIDNPAVAPLLHLLPITDAAVCLKYVLIENQGAVNGDPMSVFLLPSFYFLIINVVIWNLLGVTGFKLMENWSRYKGTLGAY